MAPTKGKHLPVMQLLNPAKLATTSVSSMCCQEDGLDQFIYYVAGGLFFRRDKIADTSQQLASPYNAFTTVSDMTYTANRGFHGRVLSASSTSIRIGGLRGNTLNGKTIKLIQGTGDGQERVLTYVGENIHDAGVITGTTSSYLQDTTKKWKYNQWAGYTLAITFGTNNTQYKTILYSDTNTLYVYDQNLLPQESWQNMPFQANAPYALPVTTAGSQAHYQIMSQDFTVPAWDVVPDYATYFTTLTGGIFMITSTASAPFFSLQYYDVIADRWQLKTVPQNILDVALATDCAIERCGKFGTSFDSGTASSGSARTLVDSTKTLELDRFKNFRVKIVGGTGIGQSRRIVCNTGTTYTVNRNWDINPDATSKYEIWGDFNRIYFQAGGRAGLLGYDIENDYWMQGDNFDDGSCANIAVKRSSGVPFGVATGTRYTNGILTVAVGAGGLNYQVGDILTVGTGTLGKVIVESVTAGGVVASVSLLASGQSYTIATLATTGGSGNGACTIQVLTRGTVCRIDTALNHFYRIGDSITVAGCNSSGYNTTYTIIGIDSLTSAWVVTAEASNMSATSSQSTTVIVDASKNWIVNEHVGKLVHLMVTGLTPTSQIRWITANTSTTITVATITAGINGTSKYAIYDSECFGSDNQYKPLDKQNYGHASGGSTTTLIDSTKNWLVNQWAGYKFRVECGTGIGSGVISIISNTATTLTYATQTFTPDATTHYEIADSWGLCTAGSTTTITEATTKNWIVNQWAGKRVRIIAGLGQGQEATITSNTATALTTGTITAPDTTSVYCIIGAPVSGAGTALLWMWGESDTKCKGRKIFRPRGGGSNTADIFDIPTGRWDYGLFFSPQQELPAIGSSYAYDGADCIYFSVVLVNTPIRIFKYDLTTNVVTGAFTSTQWEGTTTAGNLMEIIDIDGEDWLYILQHTGFIWQRAFIF